jgi:hypothetical protein
MSLKQRCMNAFLWLALTAWGIGLGAKLFDLLVVAGSWGASPPTSFARLPYGPTYPVTPGGFFQPLSIIMAVSILGALVAGWSQPKRVKTWLWVACLAFVLIWAMTPTVFWPMINQQYDIATGKAVASTADAIELTARWVRWDSGRILLIAIGFLASVRALNVSAQYTPTCA